MHEARIATWDELTDRLYAGSWQESLGRFRPNLAFRGMADARVGLATSLASLGGRYDAQEGHLLRNFRKYITERVLFPGLDGLSRWLRRYYSPRQG